MPLCAKSTVSSLAFASCSMFAHTNTGTLFVQILASVAIGAAMRTDSARLFVLQKCARSPFLGRWSVLTAYSTWTIWTSLIGAFVALFACHWKRHSHRALLPSWFRRSAYARPALNLGLLGVFTAFEAYTVGAAVSFYSEIIVLQALVITLLLFAGLTLFTVRLLFFLISTCCAHALVQFQSKYDFSSLGPWLFSAVLVFIGVGFGTCLYHVVERFADLVVQSSSSCPSHELQTPSSPDVASLYSRFTSSCVSILPRWLRRADDESAVRHPPDPQPRVARRIHPRFDLALSRYTQPLHADLACPQRHSAGLRAAAIRLITAWVDQVGILRSESLSH